MQTVSADILESLLVCLQVWGFAVESWCVLSAVAESQGHPGKGQASHGDTLEVTGSSPLPHPSSSTPVCITFLPQSLGSSFLEGAEGPSFDSFNCLEIQPEKSQPDFPARAAPHPYPRC